MAECHPVGFQWVMEAKARGATVIHVDPRFTRTSAVADLHVPLRAGTDIAFLGGLINHVLSSGQVLPRVRGELHQRGDDRQRGLRGHRGPRRAVLRLRPRAALLRPGQLEVRGRRGAGRVGRAGRRSTTTGPADRPGSRGSSGVRQAGAGRGARLRRRARRHAADRPDAASTRGACSRSSSGTSPATPPEMVEQVCGVPRAAFDAGLRADHGELRPGPDHRLRLQRRLDPAHRRACSTSAPPPSCSRCSATSAGPAAASWRCAGTPRSRAPPTSRRCSTCCPATSRCRTRTPTRTSTRSSRRRAPTRGSGRTCAPTWSACSRPAGATPRPRRTTSASTTCPG